jgi:sucrose phosphorylase
VGFLFSLLGGGRAQPRPATGAAASNLDLYQVNCTFFDAMGGDERRYLLARAIQFFLPGIPQVYYVGLLAGRNDMQLLSRSGVGRDINRHHYTPGEIGDALARPVVNDLLALIRLRNLHPAFTGSFELLESDDSTLSLRWRKEADCAELHVHLGSARYEVSYTSSGVLKPFTFQSAPPQANYAV